VGTETKTNGYEAQISGELSPGWQLQAGYTHKIARDVENEKVSTWEPEDQVSFYTSAYYGDPRNVMVTTRWDF
jgi:outer membrane receptor for ferric coprogen and ferric-rhodotorulic acid